MLNTNKRLDELERTLRPVIEKIVAVVWGDSEFVQVKGTDQRMHRIPREEFNLLFPGQDLINVRFVRP